MGDKKEEFCLDFSDYLFYNAICEKVRIALAKDYYYDKLW